MAKSSMKLTKLKLNRAGVGQILKKDATPALIDAAKSVAKRAGEGYDVYVGKTRANVSVGVQSTTDSAARDTRDNHTLNKATRR